MKTRREGSNEENAMNQAWILNGRIFNGLSLFR